MKQSTLPLIPKLSYAAKDFYIHSGIEKINKELQGLYINPEFKASYIIFGKRNGKTHYSVYIAEFFESKGYYTHIFEGEELLRFDEILNLKLDSKTCIILDSADNYFKALVDSGNFVKVYQDIRINCAKLIILADKHFSEFYLDDHVNSRLKSSYLFQLGAISDLDIDKIVERIFKQRGIKLSSKKLKLISLRAPRDISEIENLVETLLLKTGGAVPTLSLLSKYFEI